MDALSLRILFVHRADRHPAVGGKAPGHIDQTVQDRAGDLSARCRQWASVRQLPAVGAAPTIGSELGAGLALGGSAAGERRPPAGTVAYAEGDAELVAAVRAAVGDMLGCGSVCKAQLDVSNTIVRESWRNLFIKSLPRSCCPGEKMHGTGKVPGCCGRRGRTSSLS